MNIVLTGFMGTGKTAVGRRLAEELHVPFHDADMAIAKRAGKPVSEIFAKEGEPAFRELEARVIQELAGFDRVVIATGGGALLAARNRECLQQHGVLVCLNAKLGTLLERLKDDLTRPLLAGADREERVEQLLKDREAVYSQCEIQVATDGKTIAEVTEEIIRKVGDRWTKA